MLMTGARSVTFDELTVAYARTGQGLIEVAIHVLLVETIFDVLNCKAACSH